MPFYLWVLPKYEASPPQTEIPETMSPTHLLLEYLPWELVTHSCHWHTSNLTSLWPREEMKTGSQKMSAFHVCCSIIHNCWEQMKAYWRVNGQGKWSLHTFGLKVEGNLLFVTLSEINQAWIRTHGQNLHNANVVGQWFQGLQEVATSKSWLKAQVC